MRINKNISFTAYKGADWYGTPENQKALSYKVQLTPEKVNSIMKKAKNTEEGITLVYQELSKEYAHVNEAFRSMGVLTTHYMHIVKDRTQEITKMNPKGSRTPALGFFAQLGANITGTFMRKVQKQVVNIAEDFDNMIAKHFEKSINSIVDDYLKMNDYVEQGIEFVELRQGKSQVTSHLLQKVNLQKEKCSQGYKVLGEGLDKLSQRLIEVFGNIIKKQDSKQSERLINKIKIKLLTLGMG